jgi:NADH:ubiquinone oxidoreductase subunit B-like Fe-S oxidoreductase
MVVDVRTTEFWFQKLIYPIMTFGLAVCSVIFSIMVNAIDMKRYGVAFLKNLAIEDSAHQPE